MQKLRRSVTINNISIQNTSWLWWYRGDTKSPEASKTTTNTMVNMIQKYAGESKSPLIHRW
jgi:hypothetical protein